MAMLGTGEALAMYLSIWLGDMFLYLVRGIDVNLAPAYLFIPAWLVLSFAVRLLPGWGLGAVEELRRIEMSLIGLFGMAAASLFLMRGMQKSRITFLSALFFAMVLIPLFRTLMKRQLVQRDHWGIPVAIYGTRETACLMIRTLRNDPGLGFNPYAVFDDESDVGSLLEGVPIIGGMEDVTRAAPVAIVAVPNLTRHDTIRMLEGSLAAYRSVILIPDLFEAPSLWVRPRDLQGVLGLEITHNLLDPIPRFIKRFSEYSLTVLLFPLWGGIVGLLALLIWAHDRSNPFYVQSRVGMKKSRFKAYKLRTMVPHADQVLEAALKTDPDLRREWDEKCKLRNDPRITPVGRFIRATSLDELPQLVNVLRGEMSWIGPRPLPLYHHEQLPEQVRDLRERVLPGITGLWQVSGRSEVGTTGMEKWDPYYVRNWSIWLDIVILVRTFRAVFTARGAY
jgi:Undecaprenyl-phosphate galactose phosphotransferase WbaP